MYDPLEITSNSNSLNHSVERSDFVSYYLEPEEVITTYQAQLDGLIYPEGRNHFIDDCLEELHREG